jgi:gluconate kinase
MRRETLLNDEDRMPWLRRLHDELEHRLWSGVSVVLGCFSSEGIVSEITQKDLSQSTLYFLTLINQR